MLHIEVSRDRMCAGRLMRPQLLMRLYRCPLAALTGLLDFSKKGHWLPVAGVFILVSGLFIFGVLRTNEGGNPQLLSTIAQSLAAVLGIAVAVSLLASQLLAQYRPRLKQVLTGWTFCYIIVFSLTIAIPLFALSNAVSVWWLGWLIGPPRHWAWFEFSWAGISLWGLVLSLALLPSYLHYLQGIARPPFTRQPRWPDLEDTANVARRAYSLGDYHVFADKFGNLCQQLLDAQNLPNKVPKEPWDYYPSVEKELWQATLRRIVDISLETDHQPEAVKVQAEAFWLLGTRAVSKGENGRFVACQAIALLDRLGERAIARGFDRHAALAMSQLVGIATAAIKAQNEAVPPGRVFEALSRLTRLSVARSAKSS